MMSLRKSEILFLALIVAAFIALCQGLPSNSTASNTKSIPSTYTRVQRSNNKTATVTTSKPSPSSGSKTVSSSPHISRPVRSGNSSNTSHSQGSRGSSPSISSKPQPNLQTGGVRSQSTSSNLKQVRSANVTSRPPIVKSVPVRLVQNAPKSDMNKHSTGDEVGTINVSSSNVPVKSASPVKTNNSTSPNSQPSTANKPVASFIHHEEADH